MQWLHKVVGVLLLALWWPAQGHCLLERVDMSWGEDCCSEASEGPATPAKEPCSENLCCNLDSPNYKLDDDPPTVVPPSPSGLVFLLASLDETKPLAADSAGFLTLACPELRVTWQFSSRAALPPRAPNLAS